MFLHFIASTPVLIAAWILGPLVLFLIYRSNKRKKREAEPAKAGSGKFPAVAVRKDRESGATPLPRLPSMPMDVTPGFRDVKWGDAPAAAMELLNENGDESIYFRSGDVLKIEDVPVEDIKYVFTQGQLAAVRVEAPLHVGDSLLKALMQRWGAPDTQDPRAMKQQWTHLVSGPMATAAVLEKSAVSRRTTLFIFRKVERRPA